MHIETDLAIHVNTKRCRCRTFCDGGDCSNNRETTTTSKKDSEISGQHNFKFGHGWEDPFGLPSYPTATKGRKVVKTVPVLKVSH